MFEHEKQENDELLLRELLQAMDREIAEFRRLKEGIPDGGENSAEPKGSSAPDPDLSEPV